MEMRFVSTRAMQGMSTRGVRGTRRSGLINVMIAAAKIVFIYVSYGIVNVVRVKSLMSLLHCDVAPVSHFVVL